MLGPDYFEIIRRSLLIIYSVLSSFVYGYSLIQLFINARKQIDMKDRTSIRMFAYFYLLFSAVSIFLLNMVNRGEFYGYGLIILFLGLHLLPVFFQTLHLDNNFVVSVKNADFDLSLDRFYEKYDISKRETEVVQLICNGKSNQEISESLFISLQTVKDHIYRIYLKTGVKNRVQLTNLIRNFS
jgi:DNA-binding CsgD family transcriptional regulator